MKIQLVFLLLSRVFCTTPTADFAAAVGAGRPVPSKPTTETAPAGTLVAPIGETARLLREFLREATAPALSNSELADKYFCTTITHRPDKYGEQARKGLDWTLTTQRQFLREQHVNADAVRLAPFGDLSASELPPKPFHMLGETKHVYVAQYQGQIVCYFLLQDDKIASTLLIGQGIEYYFITFCR